MCKLPSYPKKVKNELSPDYSRKFIIDTDIDNHYHYIEIHKTCYGGFL